MSSSGTTVTQNNAVSSSDQRSGMTVELIVISICGALLSIALQGFIVGTGNNVFHLPIVERLYDLPQFAADPYIQSLRSYTSLFWVALRDAMGAGGRRPQSAEITAVFFTLQVFSRWLSFIGFLLCASLLGIRSRQERLIFAALLASTTLLRGNSAAGGGGLSPALFSRSEICNGLTFVSRVLRVSK